MENQNEEKEMNFDSQQNQTDQSASTQVEIKNEEAAKSEIIKPPKDDYGNDHAPRTNQSNTESDIQCMNFNRQFNRFLSLSSSREISHDSMTIEPNSSIRGIPRGTRSQMSTELNETDNSLLVQSKDQENGINCGIVHQNGDTFCENGENLTNENNNNEHFLSESSSSGYSDEIPMTKSSNKASTINNNRGRYQNENKNYNNNLYNTANKEQIKPLNADKDNNIVISTQDDNEPLILKDNDKKSTNQQKSQGKQEEEKHRSFLSASSSTLSSSISTSDVSISTLNPSDFDDGGLRCNYNEPNISSQSKKVNAPVSKSARSNNRPFYNNTNTNNNNHKNTRAQNAPQVPKVVAPTPRSQAKSARKPRYLPPIDEIPEPTESQVKLMDRAMNGEDMCGQLQPDECGELVVLLEQARRKRATDHKYKDGQRINDAIKNVKNAQLKGMKAQRQKDAAAEYNEKFEKFTADFQKFDEQTQEEKEKLKDSLALQKKGIAETHQAQKKELEEHWGSPAKMRMYNRSSNALSGLKKQHKQLLMQARFKEAEAIDQIIKEKAEQEKVANYEIYQQDFDCALKMMLAKQADEMAFFDESANIQLLKLQQKRSRMRATWENQNRKFQARGDLLKDPEKLWNSEQFMRRDNANAKMMMRNAAPSGKITTKDIQESDCPILELPPLDFRNKVPKKKKAKKAEANKEEETDV